MRGGALGRWLKRVIFWGFIISIILGFAIPHGFAIEGRALVSIFHGLGQLFGPLWNNIIGHHKVTVH